MLWQQSTILAEEHVAPLALPARLKSAVVELQVRAWEEEERWSQFEFGMERGV